MGLVALLVFAAPLLVTQVAFRKYAGIRATYLQTVRALSRVTEVGGYVEPGHSRRVSRLAVAVGRELGMSEPSSSSSSTPRSCTTSASSRSATRSRAAPPCSPTRQARRIAELGAEVIRKTGVLDRVAEIVGGSATRRGPEAAARRRRPAGSSRWRTPTTTSSARRPDRNRSAAALERLRAGSGEEYDPVVVEAMAAVVARRRRASGPASPVRPVCRDRAERGLLWASYRPRFAY